MTLSLINNKNHEMNNSQSITEQFIVKRSEISDVLYFSEESQCASFFIPIFGKYDLEMLYETSLFSVTVHDENLNVPVAIFIFNDTPSGPHKREGFPHIGGMWEEWYSLYYEDLKLDGKNSLWLIFCCISENYCLNEDTLKKIYHRVHLSLYTTLPNVKGAFILFLNNVFNDIIEAEARVDDDRIESNVEKSSSQLP